ncbi:hypothetical protein H6P81_005940 [Aristolochia fimbriata]|uniref:CDC20/Fizzy WD40 domain-containing protein n=1 Tax=Aristolochia fimbriata TaxID=158543 RepID=A0AAV7EX28_ARIFI|nr:hypothetical protein H6P81_005940 [Aristolochia fimbriata]
MDARSSSPLFVSLEARRSQDYVAPRYRRPTTKPYTPDDELSQQSCWDSVDCKLTKRRRYIPRTPDRALYASDIIDDYYTNVLDWSSSNVLAIALGNTVYLWDGSTGSSSELLTVDEDDGPITSLSWAPKDQHIAVGFNNGDVQLWDSITNKQLRTLQDEYPSRICALSWNKHILTTGEMDGLIINSDMRVRNSIIDIYRGHREAVCGLKWSSSGQHLASGGNDNLLYIWDRSASSLSSKTRWLHRLQDHTACVRALAWCPLQSNLLVSGGGLEDGCIKFWNIRTGACLNSVYTDSQICSLLWSKEEAELLSSHGYSENQLTLWKYPSMVKMTELRGHASRPLFMAQSPDGCTVASAAGDERLLFWNVFGTPQEPKRSAKTANAGPFSNYSYIR